MSGSDPTSRATAAGSDAVSLGYRTDLAILLAGGSVVDDRGDHLLVRTPGNPGFRWGNFVLLGSLPATADVPRWADVAARSFPDLAHVAVGFDVTHGEPADLHPWRSLGFAVHRHRVLTAGSVPPGPGPAPGVVHRPLVSDADWASGVDLELMTSGEDGDAARAFAVAKGAADRAVCRAGIGTWWGAFLSGRLVAQMGLVRVPGGLARFQDVQTHPGHRRRGLARGLLRHVCRTALAGDAADTLVVVVDPDDIALGLYISVGFTPVQTQLGAVLVR